jgi:hypothetical protein
MFQETVQAFVDMNGGFMLGLDPGSGRFSVRFPVEQMCKLYERFLKSGNRLIGYFRLINLASAPFFQGVRP